MHTQKAARWGIYTVGLLLLATGVILNSKTGMGVTALLSPSYCISALTGMSFGDTCLVFYILMIGLQLVFQRKGLHLIHILQIPVSFVFCKVLNLLAALLPTPENWGLRFVMLVLAVVCVGCGSAMALNMRLIPNSADGAAQAMSDCFGLEMGLCKNIEDGVCMLVALIVGFTCHMELSSMGLGIGTVVSLIFIGRVIALFNHLFRRRLLAAAGMEA